MRFLGGLGGGDPVMEFALPHDRFAGLAPFGEAHFDTFDKLSAGKVSVNRVGSFGKPRTGSDRTGFAEMTTHSVNLDRLIDSSSTAGLTLNTHFCGESRSHISSFLSQSSNTEAAEKAMSIYQETPFSCSR